MTREAAFSALFAAVSSAYPWGLASRRMKLWSEVPAALRPAFFQLESGPETYQWASPATPKRTLEAKLFLYFDARDPTTPGAIAINNALDAIDTALASEDSDIGLGRQTLGGTVYDCKITGVPVQPTMSAGYTDNRWLRNAGIPAYGVSGLFSDQGRNGVHGSNERVAVKDVYASKDFLYRLVKQLAAPGAR